MIIGPQRVVDRGSQLDLALDFNEEPQVNIAARLTAANSPIFLGTFPQQNLYVVAGNTQWFKVLNDTAIEVPLCRQRTSRECVYADVCIHFRLRLLGGQANRWGS